MSGKGCYFAPALREKHGGVLEVKAEKKVLKKVTEKFGSSK